MSEYIGSWDLEDDIMLVVNTHSTSTGSATDADSVPSYRIYEDSTGTPITTGSFSKIDDANTTGYYGASVSLSTANGFERDKFYNARIQATVGGITGVTNQKLQINASVSTDAVGGSSEINGRGVLEAFRVMESMHGGQWSFDSANNLTLKDADSGDTVAIVTIGANNQTRVS